MSHVFLIGFMGAGKTTVARLVSEALRRPCIDLDDVVAQRAGRSVREIFEEQGEASFREIESAQLEALSDAPPSVESADCRSGEVLAGRLKPDQCPMFGTICNPDHPLGATMVSAEGACAAYYRYRRRAQPVG